MKKYLLYAIGEIILVVIGILFALQINNWNENRKQKSQLKSILENVAEDLVRDTITLEGMVKFYSRIDSVSTKVINGEYNKNNIKECGLCPSLVTFYQPVVINKKGYELLKKISNNPQKRNDSLIATIIVGYDQFNALFESNNNRLEKNVVKNISDFQEYSWYVDLMSSKITDEFLDYIINDEDFKKRVVTQKVYAIGNQLAHVKLYKKYAHSVVEKIYERINE